MNLFLRQNWRYILIRIKFQWFSLLTFWNIEFVQGINNIKAQLFGWCIRMYKTCNQILSLRIKWSLECSKQKQCRDDNQTSFFLCVNYLCCKKPWIHLNLIKLVSCVRVRNIDSAKSIVLQCIASDWHDL